MKKYLAFCEAGA